MNTAYAELSQSMNPALVTVLSEHLNWVAEHPESIPHSENISQSQAAWLMAHEGFAELEQTFAQKLYEWHAKWQQRFEIEGTAQTVAAKAEVIKKTKNAKERERHARDLYLNTMHLMVGDAQKHVVSVSSRADFLQKAIRKAWHKSCPNDSYSKILPGLESTFEDYEAAFFENTRTLFFEDQKDSVPSIARREFLETIMESANCNSILNFYFSKVFRRVSKLSSSLCRFYSKKWTLYARGFNSRQNLLPLG
ncbi:MAG: hypothetical protein FWC15_04835 [Fibromonadales bacterium]|nr:hypothetical protein [Fibromonadales bacterium]